MLLHPIREHILGWMLILASVSFTAGFILACNLLW